MDKHSILKILDLPKAGFVDFSEEGEPFYRLALEKPCPFTGSAAEIRLFINETGEPEGYIHRYCDEDNFQFMQFTHKDVSTVVKEWNVRAYPKPNGVPVIGGEGDDIPFKTMVWLGMAPSGVSSRTLAFTIIGEKWRHEFIAQKTQAFLASGHPHDGADFKRCVDYLNNVPEVRHKLDLMRNVSPQWAVLVDHWEELEDLLHNELNGNYNPKASTLSERMREVLLDVG